MLEKVGIGRAAGVRVCRVPCTAALPCAAAHIAAQQPVYLPAPQLGAVRGLPEGPGVTQPAAGWGLKPILHPSHLTRPSHRRTAK